MSPQRLRKHYEDKAERGFMCSPTWQEYKTRNRNGFWHACCKAKSHHRHKLECTEEMRAPFFENEGNEKWKALAY